MLNQNIISLALKLAKKSYENNEIPVGCVIFDSKGIVISSSYNSTLKNNDPTAHAEILAIRKACKKLKIKKLIDFSIYTTLEPCKMCEHAIYNAGIKQVFFGAYSENFKIFKNKQKNYHYEILGYQYYGGIEERKCSELLKIFFKKKR